MNDFDKLFSYFNPPEPRADLFGKIINRINEEREMVSLKRRIFIFSAGLLCSIAAVIPAFRMARAGFFDSGFLSYFSLLFSDTAIVMAYWKNFSFSLLETLPVIEIAAVSAVILVFLELFKFLINDIRSYRTGKSYRIYKLY